MPKRAARARAASDRPAAARGIVLAPLERSIDGDTISYPNVDVSIDRELGAASITVRAPSTPQPVTPDELVSAGSEAWIVAAARELDDAMLHLRFNETEVGTWVVRTEGDLDAVLAADSLLAVEADDWLVREVSLYWTRTLKRLDLSARTIIALVEPGSCFAGILAELALAADRTYMLDGTWEDADRADGDRADIPPAVLRLTEASTGRHPMSNGLSRLQTRSTATTPAHPRWRSGKGCRRERQRRHVTFHPDDMTGTTRSARAEDATASRPSARAWRPNTFRGARGRETRSSTPFGVAELDLPATERGRPRRSAPALRHRIPGHLRPPSNMTRGN